MSHLILNSQTNEKLKIKGKYPFWSLTKISGDKLDPQNLKVSGWSLPLKKEDTLVSLYKVNTDLYGGVNISSFLNGEGLSGSFSNPKGLNCPPKFSSRTKIGIYYKIKVRGVTILRPTKAQGGKGDRM